MFSKKIKFSAHEDYVYDKIDEPVPIKLNIPEWFKKLQHSIQKPTIKGCMPFLDTLTSGYLLKVPQDFILQHNVEREGKIGSFFQPSLYKVSAILSAKHVNLNSMPEVHISDQLKGSPLNEKNKHQGINKILNPWTITTPPGYSCLFVPPLNNTDDRFSIIPGIVDTDSFNKEINFPFIVNGDKYPHLDTIIKKGTPYVQVIPFKRDSWKMEISSTKQSVIQKRDVFYELTFIERYKNKFWKKKTWN
jgi:hypothetical protein